MNENPIDHILVNAWVLPIIALTVIIWDLLLI